MNGIVFKSVCLTLALVSAFLANHSWWLSSQSGRLERPALDSASNPVQQNLFDALAELDRQLDFMVWPAERQALLKQKLKVLQSLLNEFPLDYEVWLKLIRVEGELNIESADVSWSLVNALQLGGWNSKTHWDLIYFCVALKHEIEHIVNRRCDDLFRSTHLASRLNWVARRLRIDEEFLSRRFEGARGRR